MCFPLNFCWAGNVGPLSLPAKSNFPNIFISSDSSPMVSVCVRHYSLRYVVTGPLRVLAVSQQSDETDTRFTCWLPLDNYKKRTTNKTLYYALLFFLNNIVVNLMVLVRKVDNVMRWVMSMRHRLRESETRRRSLYENLLSQRRKRNVKLFVQIWQPSVSNIVEAGFNA